MKYKVRAFGVTKDILGGKEIVVEMQDQTVAALREKLLSDHPSLAGLRSLLIAVNNVYAENPQTISENDEIALIPPVSGG
ncbi:MAG TPA: MoaD/ThiS family protein [Ohtaekwangia sp.]|nr:MoaD/ThiS family protein [Ohtaekwangia sp.]